MKYVIATYAVVLLAVGGLYIYNNAESIASFLLHELEGDRPCYPTIK